jgi:hypothetical protein
MLTLRSSSFSDRGPIPQQFGKRAENISPQLSWHGPPDGTRSFALAMVDLHPIAKGYVHWLVVDIDPHVSALSEGAAHGAMPRGARELVPYAGPFPPSGTHDYQITLYALSAPTMKLRPGVSLLDFTRALQPHTLAAAQIVGQFTRLG